MRPICSKTRWPECFGSPGIGLYPRPGSVRIGPDRQHHVDDRYSRHCRTPSLSLRDGEDHHVAGRTMEVSSRSSLALPVVLAD